MTHSTPENINTFSRRHFLKQGIASGITLGATSQTMLNAAEGEPKTKIKALLVTGGGYHDELKKVLSKEDWSTPYDIVVYSICHAMEEDANYINNIVNVHKAGKPMVAIHCTLHSYHWKIGGGKKSKEDKEWNKLIGAVSLNHGPQGPAIKVTNTEGDKHDSYKPTTDEWKTPKGELYNITKVYPTATVLASQRNHGVS